LSFSALQRAENSSRRFVERQFNDMSLRFSALQRAENSSSAGVVQRPAVTQRFQCSSASRKFLKPSPSYPASTIRICFSALQRAENSSSEVIAALRQPLVRFSALQRAENSSSNALVVHTGRLRARFSALQRAENSSRRCCRCLSKRLRPVSVLFSEPKIPQVNPHLPIFINR